MGALLNGRHPVAPGRLYNLLVYSISAAFEHWVTEIKTIFNKFMNKFLFSGVAPAGNSSMVHTVLLRILIVLGIVFSSNIVCVADTSIVHCALCIVHLFSAAKLR